MEHNPKPELNKFEQFIKTGKSSPDSIKVSEKQELTQEKTDSPQETAQEKKKQLETNSKRKFHLPSFHRAQPIIPKTHDEITLKVEKILEEGLQESFQRLSPIAREEFKLKGEQTTFKIRELLQNTHVKAKKIFQLIFEWLKMLPGINKFFLEQEAKIKTDRIMMVKNKK